MYNGYDFYLGDLKLPIAPPSLEIKVGSNNKSVNLIQEGDINILKSPALIEVRFQARFPMRNYPYAPEIQDFQSYYDKIRQLKENKKPFRFIIARQTNHGIVSWDTNLEMALESFTFKESWDEGDDVLIDFELKQFKAYGTKSVKMITDNTNGQKQMQKTNTNPSRTEKAVNQTNYKVKSGDSLYNIAKEHFGDASKWGEIYEKNKSVIENAARQHGKNSSSNGHWIYPNTELVLPAK